MRYIVKGILLNFLLVLIAAFVFFTAALVKAKNLTFLFLFTVGIFFLINSLFQIQNKKERIKWLKEKYDLSQVSKMAKIQNIIIKTQTIIGFLLLILSQVSLICYSEGIQAFKNPVNIISFVTFILGIIFFLSAQQISQFMPTNLNRLGTSHIIRISCILVMIMSVIMRFLFR